MKTLYFTTTLVSLLLFSLNLSATDHPNIVVIMADDLGLGDLACYQEQFQNKTPLVSTPNIDSLARDGMFFRDGHSSTALCSPTRYCMMSGNLNYRSYAVWGVWQCFRPSPFTSEDATLGRIAKSAGLNTGFVGKWHLGGDFRNPQTGDLYRGNDRLTEDTEVDLTHFVGGGPKYAGFDYDFTIPSGIQGPLYIAYENEQWYPLGKDSRIIYMDETTALDPIFVSDKGSGMGDSNWDTREMGKILSQKAVDFIHQQTSDKAFLLYYCSPTVHLPHCPPESFDGLNIAHTTPSRHMDMIRDLDQQVGRIIRELKARGLYENTLIFFTSDNGGLRGNPQEIAANHDSTGGWRGSKNDPWEGGHRIPFIVSWPGKIAPGSVQSEAAINHDFVATLADLLGIELKSNQAMDSYSFLPLLTGQKSKPRPYLMQQSGSRNEIMFRKDGWKLIMQSNPQCTVFEPIALFNLEENPLEVETSNLVHAQEYSNLVQSMREAYLSIRNNGFRTVPLSQ